MRLRLKKWDVVITLLTGASAVSQEA